MKKYLLFVFMFLIVRDVFARQDSSVYYLKNSGEQVATKDSADLIIHILPKDPNTANMIYPVKGYYPNGKIRLLASSKTPTLPLTLLGDYTEFFPNGNKMRIRKFNNGLPADGVIEYYPNGNIYNKKEFKVFDNGNRTLLFEECRDSTGKVLTENGDGDWITFNSDFTMVKESGRVRDGLRDSAWTLLSSDGQTQTRVYSKGILVSTQSNNGNPPTPSADSGYSPVEQVPEFPGGLDAFARFLSKNVGYPNQARDNNVTGRVLNDEKKHYLSFVDFCRSCCQCSK
jgi:antitoxin component YwqK of YwqJK toxin-antitoxin module